MTKLKNATVNNGRINWIEGSPAVAPRVERDGNVTVNYEGTEAVPAYFQTSFMIEAEIEEGGISVNNIFHWDGIVIEKNDGSSYREIETLAVNKIAPLIRELADKIETQIAEFEKRKK